MTVSFSRSLPTFLGDIHRSRHARRKTPKRDALARRAREILRPFGRRRFASRELSPVSLSLSLPFRFFSLSVYAVLFLSHTCLLSFLVDSFPPSFSLSLFVLKFSSPVALSSFPLQIQFFLPLLVSVDLSFFFFPLLSRCRNERVPRNSSMGFKTSTSRCPRKARTEEERATDASNGLRVRPFTNSTADPRTHTHARARWRKGRNRERERERARVRSIAEKGRSRARARARAEKEREMQRSEGGNRGMGKGERVGTKETGKANESGRTQRRSRRRIVPTVSSTPIAGYRSTFEKRDHRRNVMQVPICAPKI